jgi:hypothetical protein
VFKHVRVTPSGIAVGVILTLIVGSGTAFAANGSTLRIGKKNKATKVTTIQSKKGTPLSLKAGKNKRGKRKAPLKINSKRKVKKLNADLLDGKSSGVFARKSALTAGRTGVIVGRGGDEDAPGHAYAVAVATCPAGTQLTGGGGFAKYADDALWYSGPGKRPNTWEVDSRGDGIVDNGKELIAYAVCFNPTGAVRGAMTFPKLHALAATLRAGQ